MMRAANAKRGPKESTPDRAFKDIASTILTAHLFRMRAT